MLIVLLKNKQSASRIYLQFKNYNIFPLPQIKNLPTLKNTKLFIVCGIVALIETPMSQKTFHKETNMSENGKYQQKYLSIYLAAQSMKYYRYFIKVNTIKYKIR